MRPNSNPAALLDAINKMTLRNNNNNNSHGNERTAALQLAGKGRCKWFNVAKGWGFITPLNGGQEVFVHQSVIQMSGFRSLGEMEEVEYECKLTERGLEATRVSGRHGKDCHGSTFKPHKQMKKRTRRIRCYNCGEFADHIASKCDLAPQPKRCHNCKKEDHLFINCPYRAGKSYSSRTNSSLSGKTRSSSFTG